MPFADLPSRGERSVPSFKGRAEELSQYFSELEALYSQHVANNENEKKQGVLKYLATVALKRTWQSSNTIADATKTYDNFKEEMYKLYLCSSDDIFTIHHLDTLIRQCICLGVKNVVELGDFHLQFRTISKYLISKNWMSQAEQT
jgi:hypothetical protein